MMMPWFFIKNSSISTEKSLGNGQLYFEINQYLGKDMVALLEKLNQKHWIAKRYLWQRKDDSRDDLRFLATR
jgi:release factor glutamine methyltransferase